MWQTLGSHLYSETFLAKEERLSPRLLFQSLHECGLDQRIGRFFQNSMVFPIFFIGQMLTLCATIIK